MEQPKPKRVPIPAQTPDEKARVLMELIGERRKDKSLSGLVDHAKRSRISERPVNKATLRQSARELLSRLGETRSVSRSSRHGPMTEKVLRSTVASLLNGRHLGTEHPEVIALVLEKQPAAAKLSVLKGLEGPLARRVHRALARRTKAT